MKDSGMSFFSPRSRLRLNPLITAVIVGAWLVLIGSLVKDRYFHVVSDIAESFSLSAAETDDWFLIRIRGAYSGFGRSRQYRKGDNWILRDDLNIALNIQGQIKPIRIKSMAEVDGEFRLISFTLKVASGIVSFEQSGHMEGRDLVLKTPATRGGGTKRLKLFERPRISRSLGLPVPLTGLQVRDEIKVPVFDPLDGNKWDAIIQVLEKAELEITGRKVTAWLVRAIYRTIELSMWIDDQGRLLKGTMPLGITVIRSSKEEISNAMQGLTDLPEMMALSAVPLEGTIQDPRKLTFLRMRILKGNKLPMVSDSYRQTRKEDTVTITKETVPEATYSLPAQMRGMLAYLDPSRFIRSEAPQIIEKAKEIIGAEKDPMKAAKMINQWVYKYLKKVPTPAVPDAVTILETRQGDCNEHAVLAAALARAVGIPARISLGLVYLDDGFYYHAWNTYWSGKHWITGDALVNQFPADATHVTLLIGDVGKHTNVLTFLGKLEFALLEAK